MRNPRLFFVPPVAALALLGVACGRGPRRAAEVPAPAAPAAGDTAEARRAAEAAARADSARRDSVRADSVRADSVRADSLARDSLLAAQKPAPPAPAGPAGRPKQERRCQLDFPNTPETRYKAVKDPATGRYNNFVGGGVVGRCVGQDVTLYADSAELYDTIKLYYLFGNVRYREARVNIDADRVTYFLNEERILAEQNVRAALPSGSTMTGPQAEYFRPVAPIRRVAELVAVQRPTFTIVQRDSAGKAGPPATLLADRVRVMGDSLYYAGGNVDITRPDLHATSDSAFMDEQRQYGRLTKRPEIEGRGERKFVLRGQAVDLFSKNRQVDRVVAVDSAHAVSGELDLKSDTIDLRITNEKLSRAFAWGPSRAHAVSPDRTIIADSLDVQMPDQHVSEVHALGQAYAETAPDSTKLKSDERDWLRGDTIVAMFDSALTSDTASRPRIRELTATGSASSFYQIPSNKGADSLPNLNYVRGSAITVSFADQEVQSVVVKDEAVGLFLEPGNDSTQTTGRPRPGAPTTSPRGPVPSAVPPIRRPTPTRRP